MTPAKRYYKPGALARNADLAAIHIAKADLMKAGHLAGDDAYRDLLWAIARVRSAADLDHTGRKTVLEHLGRLCAANKRTANQRAFGTERSQPNPWAFVDSAASGRQPMLKKLIMLAKGKPQRGYPYATGVAKHMFGQDGAVAVRIELLDASQIHKVVAALEIDIKRKLMVACGNASAAHYTATVAGR